MDAKKFGLFISEVRKGREMTQAELADKIHVTDKAVSRWERGIGFPDINTLEPLAEALGVSMMELMQSKRRSGESEDPSQAILDAVSLAQQERCQTRYNSAVGILCLGMLLFTLAVLGPDVLAGAAVFYFALAALMIAEQYRKNSPDQESTSICKGVAVISVGVMAGALVLMLPDIVVERYGSLFALLCTGFAFFNTVRQLADGVREGWTKQRKKMIAMICLDIPALLLIGFSVKIQIDRIQESAVSERVNVVQQYADALIKGKFDLEDSDLTGHTLTYASPVGQYPEVFYASYQFEDAAGKEITYSYQLCLEPDFTLTVAEERERLGAEIISETTAENEET